MNLQLEVFFAKLSKDKINYYRELIDVSKKSENPDQYVDELVERLSEKFNIYKERCIIHSTSWRCAHCDLVSLTYIVYSDFLNFADYKTSFLPISELSLAEGTINKPKPVHLEEKHIIAHALRHLSMLIEKNPDTYKPALSKVSFDSFNKIAISLAGKI